MEDKGIPLTLSAQPCKKRGIQSGGGGGGHHRKKGRKKETPPTFLLLPLLSSFPLSTSFLSPSCPNFQQIYPRSSSSALPLPIQQLLIRKWNPYSSPSLSFPVRVSGHRTSPVLRPTAERWNGGGTFWQVAGAAVIFHFPSPPQRFPQSWEWK